MTPRRRPHPTVACARCGRHLPGWLVAGSAPARYMIGPHRDKAGAVCLGSRIETHRPVRKRRAA